MQKTLELKARPRTDKGTKAARRFRTGDPAQVPAILYGGALPDGKPNREVQHILVSKDDLGIVLKKHGLIYELALEGGKKEVAIMKEVQRDVFGEFVMHVDFERVDLNKAIHVNVNVTYKGTPIGQTKGGHLRIETYTIAVEALPLDVPDEILVKVDALDMDQVLRMKDITLPQGVKALIDQDQVLCAVRAAVEEKEPEPGVAGAEGAAVEPEVIGLKKKDEEGEGEEGADDKKDKKKE